jgi:hypothetical protein
MHDRAVFGGTALVLSHASRPRWAARAGKLPRAGLQAVRRPGGAYINAGRGTCCIPALQFWQLSVNNGHPGDFICRVS